MAQVLHNAGELNDPIFVKEGTAACRKDLPHAEVIFVDSGYCAHVGERACDRTV